MKTTKQTAANVAAKTATEKAATAKKESVKTAEIYVNRCKLAVKDVTSPSKLFRACSEYYGDAIASLEFKAWLSSLKKRHNVADKGEPRKWSAWYAVQICEKHIREAADNERAKDHAAAIEYLYKEKAAARKEELARKLAKQGGKIVQK